MAPLVHSGGVSLMSYGSAALRVWYQLASLNENLRRRDAFNSSHTVFTSVNANMCDRLPTRPSGLD